MKRLYVRRGGARGGCRLGIDEFGSSNAQRHSAIAQAMLDTLPWMSSAIAIYRAQGFAPIPPYWDNAVPGILYFGKRLQPD